MKKRLRKKKRLGEFRERGFLIEYRLEPNVWEADDVLDRLVNEIEQRGLACGGGTNADGGQLYVQHALLGSVTAAERNALAAWCECESLIAAYRAAPLVWQDEHDPCDESSRGEWVVKPRFSCS